MWPWSINRRMIATLGSRCGRLRQRAEMIEHDRAGQAVPQACGVDDLVAAQVDLHVPAEIVHPPGERLDHVEGGDGGARVELGEADAADAALREGLELGVGDRGMHDRDAAGVAELRDGVERDAVVSAVGGGLHHHGAGSADALLQQPVVGGAAVALHS